MNGVGSMGWEGNSKRYAKKMLIKIWMQREYRNSILFKHVSNHHRKIIQFLQRFLHWPTTANCSSAIALSWQLPSSDEMLLRVDVLRALAIETISFKAVTLCLLIDMKYSRVHDPQFCSENNKATDDSFPVTLLNLRGVCWGWHSHKPAATVDTIIGTIHSYPLNIWYIAWVE